MGVKISSCQYTHGVAHWLLGPRDTLSCVLIYTNFTELKNMELCMQ